MKTCRSIAGSALALLLALSLSSCGNPYEGGSEPSGSVITIESIEPVEDALTPDITLSVCSVDSATGEVTYEEGLTNSYVDVVLRNSSRPNTPDDTFTASYVTMNRYRVDFTGLNMSVSIPSIDGAGVSVGIDKDGTNTMQALVLDYATMEYIQSHYPTVGHGETLTLRAHITIWGEDAFGVTVSVEGDFTMVVADYDRC